jgi:hypothetical protein
LDRRTTSRAVCGVRRFPFDTAEQDLRRELFEQLYPHHPAISVHFFQDMFYLESSGISYDTLLRHSLRPVSLFLLHRFYGYAYSGNERKCTCTRNREPTMVPGSNDRGFFDSLGGTEVGTKSAFAREGVTGLLL